jgi:hypothetical protein
MAHAPTIEENPHWHTANHWSNDDEEDTCRGPGIVPTGVAGVV